MTQGITLHSATVNMVVYNSSMPLYLYFCNDSGITGLVTRNSVVKIVKFEANNYNPSELRFDNQVWTEPTGTYYAIWSQYDNTQPYSPTNGNRDMRMVITDDPKEGSIPSYRHTPKTGYWYWTGTIDATPILPSAPTINAISNQNAQVSLSWTAPFNGGSSISNYVVQYRSNPQGGWIFFSNPTSTSTSETVTGLTNGTLHYFQVAAINSIGQGPFSNQASATPSTVPGAPIIQRASGLNKQVQLSWTAPNDGGSPIMGYLVSFVDAQTATSLPSTTTSYVMTELTNGTTYNFQIIAYNANGNGVRALVSATPSVLVLFARSNLNAQVPLTWSGGSSIMYYVVQYRFNSQDWITFSNPTSTSTSETVTGLTNGILYYFQVTEVNASGTGSFNQASATPSTVPSAPTINAISNLNKQVQLTWAAPFNGGSPIINYVVQYRFNPQGGWILFSNPTSTSTSETVTGLTNGILHYFQVAAVNASGTGVFNQASATPSTVPDAPVNFKAVPGNAQVHLSWSAGASDGGSPITNFKVEYKLATSSVWTVQYSMTTLTIYFLKNRSPYNFKVSAINANGPSDTATADATPRAPFTTSCGIRGFVPGPPPWSRAGGNNCPNCDSNYGTSACGDAIKSYSTYALDQRRKVEILKYRNNSAQLSPAQQYSMLSRNAFTRKKAWATQTQTYTNPNVNNLPETQRAGVTVALECNQPPVRCSLTSGSDVPGPVIPLCIDESVPLYNYKMQVTYSSGGKFESVGAFEQPKPIPMPTPTPNVLIPTVVQRYDNGAIGFGFATPHGLNAGVIIVYSGATNQLLSLNGTYTIINIESSVVFTVQSGILNDPVFSNTLPPGSFVIGVVNY